MGDPPDCTGVFRAGVLQGHLSPTAALQDLIKPFDSGLFTTILVQQGKLINASFHKERLLHDAGVAGFSMHATFLDAAFSDAQAKAKDFSERYPNTDGMIRLIFVQEEECASVPLMKWLTISESRRNTKYNKCLSDKLYVIDDPRAAPVFKSTDRSWCNGLYLQKRGLKPDGYLMVGPEGVREGDFFHLFICRDGAWKTSPVCEVVSYGTTRSQFLGLLTEQKHPIKEEFFSLDELFDADAVVSTSSLKGLSIVSQIDEVALAVRVNPFDFLLRSA